MNPAALTDAIVGRNAQLADRFDQAASIGCNQIGAPQQCKRKSSCATCWPSSYARHDPRLRSSGRRSRSQVSFARSSTSSTHNTRTGAPSQPSCSVASRSVEASR